jgi:hypothetical protein
MAERRERDEQALAAEVASRREALLGELATQEERHRAEARRIVDAASTEARAVLAESTAEAERSRVQTREQMVRSQEELDQLRSLQHQIAEQLTGVRSLLDWTLPRITAAGPAPLAAGALLTPAPSAHPMGDESEASDGSRDGEDDGSDDGSDDGPDTLDQEIPDQMIPDQMIPHERADAAPRPSPVARSERSNRIARFATRR